MKSKNILILLLIVVAIFAFSTGVALSNPFDSKEATKVKITSDKSQYEGGKLTVKLTDLNNTPISKEKLNITIIDKKGKVVVNKTVKTNSKGNAKLDLDLKEGKYKVNVTYAGNENYTGNNATQNLTIEEEVVEEAVESSSYDSGAFYSHQEGRTIYTGEVQAGPDGRTWKHLGNNEWVKID